MARVLVTGGTGVLGREVVRELMAAGADVRVMSRRRPADHTGVEWAPADLVSGEGLAEAIAGANVIVHCATGLPPRTRQTDVEGTARLLDRAGAAGVEHLVFISIVGIDRVPSYPYFRHKLAAEALVRAGSVPWSILRATQFHQLIERGLQAAARLPVMLLPTDFQFQPIHHREVAARLAQAVADGPGSHLPDIGGPEVLTGRELADAWLRARGLRRRVVRLPLPGRTAAGFRQGRVTCPEARYGRLSWADWLRETAGDEQVLRPEAITR